MASIGIIDYGMGNLHSASKALQHAAPDADVFVSSDANRLSEAARLVLPGVGGAGHCADALRATGLDALVKDQLGKKPLLGICVGMQLLFDHSEENGGTDCLGIVPGNVLHFPANIAPLKIPHMGWNQVAQRPHPLWENIDDGSRFYFVHSYYCTPADAERAAGTTTHGVTATAAVQGEPDSQLFAVQFHPEKSHKAGLQLLANFAYWNGRQK